MNYKDKNISVIGMARSGIAAANFLVKQGAHVTLVDGKPREALSAVLEQLSPGVNTVFQSSKPLTGADLVILSPGVDIHSPDLNSARSACCRITRALPLAIPGPAG